LGILLVGGFNPFEKKHARHQIRNRFPFVSPSRYRGKKNQTTSLKNHHVVKHAVDGRNPAPPDMYETL